MGAPRPHKFTNFEDELYPSNSFKKEVSHGVKPNFGTSTNTFWRPTKYFAPQPTLAIAGVGGCKSRATNHPTVISAPSLKILFGAPLSTFSKPH